MKLIRMMLICFAAVMMAACGGQVGGKPTLMVSIAPQKYWLLDTSDAADDLLCVEPGGRRNMKKKKKQKIKKEKKPSHR